MAQSGFTPVQLYRSTTAAAVPLAANLAAGELAINLTDEKLYFENASGVVKVLADSTYVGTVTSVAASGGTTGLTFSGSPITSSGTLTLSGTLAVANGGTGTATALTAGSVVFAGASGVYSQDNANLFWDDTNNRLGIGTTSPTSRLTVTGGDAEIRDGNYLTLRPVGNGWDMRLQATGTQLDVLSGGALGSPIMSLLNGGNVGIGTSSPTLGKLVVSQASSGTATLALESQGSWNASIAVNSSGNLIFSNAAATERMRITNAGNVGIGETAPGARLHVSGGVVGTTAGNLVNVTIDQGGAGANVVGIRTNLVRVSSGTDWTTTAMRLQGRVDATDFGYIDLVSGGAQGLAFGSSTSERMRIDSSGNVGIGTVSPATLLSVNGSATANENFFSVTGGVWFNAANVFTRGIAQAGSDVALYTSGIERMRILSGGNVGIGTATPEAVLDINGGQVTRGDANGYVYFAPKNGTTPFGANYDRFEIRVDPSTQVTLLGNTQGGTGAARALAFLAGTNERMRIESDGDVGIGTTAPTTIFHVQQNNASNIGMRMRQLSTTQFAGAGLLCNGPVSSGAQGGTAFYHYNRNTGGTNGALAMAQFDETGAFQRSLAEYYYQEQAWLFYTNSNERMRITSSGNVGIGTASPGVSLDVVGGIRARGGVPGALGVNNNGYAFNTPGDNDTGMFSSADGQLEFYSNNGEVIRISSAGLVGINNTSPTVTLDVTGGIKTSRTAVTAPATSDGNIFSGTYTPTLTNSTNVDISNSTAYTCQYMRVGDVVTVSGRVSIAVIGTGITRLNMTLPVSSNFSAEENCAGTAQVSYVGVSTNLAAQIKADTTNDRAQILYYGNVTGSAQDFFFAFTYRII